MSELLRQIVSGGADLPSDASLYLSEQPGGAAKGWTLFDEGKLAESINLDGNSLPRWALPSGFAEVFRSVGISETQGVAHSVEALSRMVAVGSCNGDYLFVSSGGVFAFRHDGHELELLSSRWTDFTATEGADPSVLPPGLIGIWDPTHSETEPEDMFAIFCPVLHLRESGDAEQEVGDESLLWRWATKPGRLSLSGSDGTVDYWHELSESGLDLRSLDGDYHCHYAKRSNSQA